MQKDTGACVHMEPSPGRPRPSLHTVTASGEENGSALGHGRRENEGTRMREGGLCSLCIPLQLLDYLLVALLSIHENFQVWEHKKKDTAAWLLIGSQT